MLSTEAKIYVSGMLERTNAVQDGSILASPSIHDHAMATKHCFAEMVVDTYNEAADYEETLFSDSQTEQECQHGILLPLELEKMRISQKRSSKFNFAMSPLLKRVSNCMHKVIKHERVRPHFDKDESSFADDDDLEDSLHLTKQRFERKAQAQWEKEASMGLKHSFRFPDSPTLPKNDQRRTVRAVAA